MNRSAHHARDPKNGARLRQANRAQISWGRIDVDAQLPEDHPARAVVAVIDKLDLSALYRRVEARDELAGAPAIDPKILLALWVYATSEGENSARQIERLTEMHAAYRWICGGVAVSYHTLSDFRGENGAIFNELVTQVLALLMQHDLLDLTRVAQDGTRLRASAGASSFRRAATLEELRVQARAHLDAVSRDPDSSARKAAAQKRAAEDRLRRLEAALAEVPGVTTTKQRSGAKDTTVRVSSTDPEARVMKMGDGGSVDGQSGLPTTCSCARPPTRRASSSAWQRTNRGSDMGESTPMLAQVEHRTGVRPAELLVDGGYAKHQAIDEAAERNVTLYAPLPKPRAGDGDDPHSPRPDDSEAVAAWRQRMATDEAKQIYKQRAAVAETVNADAKAHRGQGSVPVRGLGKVIASVSLFVLTYDLLRLITLTA